jgi:hypothetical protein
MCLCHIAKHACTSILSSPLGPVQGFARRPRITHLNSRLVSIPTSAISSSEPPCPALGNFFLSSCPGKKGVAPSDCCIVRGFTNNLITTKVRLTGPVRGRGAICRDLKQDLRRIKALGVGCIVWYDNIDILPVILWLIAIQLS